MATWSARRSRSEPCWTPTSSMLSKVARSNAVPTSSWPSTFMGVLARPEGASTSGRAATARSSSGLSPSPENPSAAMTRSPPNWARTVSSIDALIEAPTTVNSDTTATPTISADAVPAVRRGVRMALRRASERDSPRRGGTAQGGDRAEQGEADQGRQGAEPGDGQRAVATGAGDDTGHPEPGQHDADRGPDPRGARAVDGHVPQGGQRGGARGPHGGGDRGRQRHRDAHRRGDGQGGAAHPQKGHPPARAPGTAPR